MSDLLVLPEGSVDGQNDGPRIVDMEAGRRAFLRHLGLGIAGAAMMAGTASAFAQTPGAPGGATIPSQPDLDLSIVNFALNLEYLEATFYLRAIGQDLTAAEIDGMGTLGAVTGGRAANFSTSLVASYADEIANDEHTHVVLFRGAAQALGGPGAQVARPALNIDGGPNGAFTAAARAAGIIGPTATFDPYAGDVNFLLAAYIFEDVGVTAFSGAAPLVQRRNILAAAAGVLAVEAYHAGLIRTVLFATNVTPPNFNYKATAGISNLRRTLSGANDDQGIGPDQSTLAGGKATRSNIVPTGANGVAFARSPRQVLNIVYGAQNAHSGLFFPNGLNTNAVTPAGFK